MAAADPQAKIGSLSAFIDQVQADITSGKLTKAQGQPLIDYAEAAIQMVQSQ